MEYKKEAFEAAIGPAGFVHVVDLVEDKEVLESFESCFGGGFIGVCFASNLGFCCWVDEGECNGGDTLDGMGVIDPVVICYFHIVCEHAGI